MEWIRDLGAEWALSWLAVCSVETARREQGREVKEGRRGSRQ